MGGERVFNDSLVLVIGGRKLDAWDHSLFPKRPLKFFDLKKVNIFIMIFLCQFR